MLDAHFFDGAHPVITFGHRISPVKEPRMIRSPAQHSPLRQTLLVLFMSFASLLSGAISAPFSPVVSVLFAPFCGLAVLIGIAADDIRTGKASHAGLTLAASVAIICGPFGAIATLIVR